MGTARKQRGGDSSHGSLITKHQLNEAAARWGLRDIVVEKDYVLGWLLWGIGASPRLSGEWIFKGGTCLKKCYIETHRFSEDLDFTIRPATQFRAGEANSFMAMAMKSVEQRSGIRFEYERSQLRIRPDGRSAEGRIYYWGPRGARDPARIKLDLSLDERVARPPVNRLIRHEYPDSLPAPGWTQCYCFEELFAEKIRAMGERSRPRDLYDIITLFRRRESIPHFALIREVFVEKCVSKGLRVFDAAAIESSDLRHELVQEWTNMLGHQLPELPDFNSYWEDVPRLFNWLDGNYEPEELAPIPFEGESDLGWYPRSSVDQRTGRSTIELIRFAAINYLCIRIHSGGESQVLEPYEIRRLEPGWLELRALERVSAEMLGIRIDRIDQVEVLPESFEPRFATDMGSTRLFDAPPAL